VGGGALARASHQAYQACVPLLAGAIGGSG